MSISSLSSSSTVQHTINNSSKDVYEHFEFIFVAFATSFNTYFDKIIYHGFTQISQSCEVCILYKLCLLCCNCCLLCWHYAQDYAGIIDSSLYYSQVHISFQC